MIEDRLQSALEQAAATVSGHDIDRSIIKRARRRIALTGGVLSVAVVVGVAGASLALMGAGSRDPLPPVASPTSTEPSSDPAGDEAAIKGKIAKVTERLSRLSSQRVRVGLRLGTARDEGGGRQIIETLVARRNVLDQEIARVRALLDELLGQLDERIQTSFECPHLIPPGPRAEREMRPAVNAYLDERQPKRTDGYHYRVKRMTGRWELGFPAGDCSLKTWRRSFRVAGSFEYEKGVTSASASLVYFRVYAGRTKDGWVVWFEAH